MIFLNYHSKGSILITTLWIMAILSLFAMGVGFRASLEVRLSKYNMDKLQAFYVAKAGIVKASDRLLNDYNRGWDSLYECGISLLGEETPETVFGAEYNKLGNSTFSIYYIRKKDYEGGQDIYYGLIDEESKININMSKTALGNIGEYKRILKGLSPSLTDEMINAIIDWQDGGDFDSETSPGGAEDFFYETEYGYSSKDADFEVLEELLLVRGMTNELFNEIKHYITVYGDGKININTAQKEVLNALINENDIYTDLVNRIIEFRNGGDGMSGTYDDQVFTETEQIKSIANEDNVQEKTRIDQLISRMAVKSSNFRATSHAEVGRVKKEVTCVIKREPGSGNVKIEYYHEE